MKSNKVIITGTDMATDRSLCVVKDGDFPKTTEGIVSALKAGLLDKFGEFAPEYIVVAAVPRTSSNPNVVEFGAILKQLADNGRDVVAMYSANVQFKAV